MKNEVLHAYVRLTETVLSHDPPCLSRNNDEVFYSKTVYKSKLNHLTAIFHHIVDRLIVCEHNNDEFCG